MEFAGGEHTHTVEVCENVRGYIKENDAVAGILITNASRKMDLEGILADGTPTIEFVDRIAEITAAPITGDSQGCAGCYRMILRILLIPAFPC